MVQAIRHEPTIESFRPWYKQSGMNLQLKALGHVGLGQRQAIRHQPTIESFWSGWSFSLSPDPL